MAIELATQYLSYVDELFAAESKRSLLTNQDFAWDGAHTVKVYSVSTAAMNDYGRTGAAQGNWSRYGAVKNLDATTQSMTLSKDRSFTFAIDKLDTDETRQQVQAASALARQLREVSIPEIDAHVYARMAAGAGHTPTAVALTAANIYDAIIAGSLALDDAEVPDTERRLVVTPTTYQLMKKSPDIVLETDVSDAQRKQGVISMIDGLAVIRVPASRLPEGFGFMIAHPSATVAPLKLEQYRIHEDPPGISGALVEGRIVYDAFVLENKKKAIYLHRIA